MGFEELTKDEQSAFFVLVTKMAHIDGTVTAEETEMFGALARRLGEVAFWEGMREAQEEQRSPYAAAKTITRERARRFTAEVLREIAACDEFVEVEHELLRQIEEAWFSPRGM